MSSQQDLFRLLKEGDSGPTIERWFQHNTLEPFGFSTSSIFEFAVQDKRWTSTFVSQGHLDSLLQCAVRKGWLLSFRRLLQMVEASSSLRSFRWTPSQQLSLTCLKKGSHGSTLFFMRLLKKMFRSPSVAPVPGTASLSPSRKELEDFCWFALSFWENAKSVLRLLQRIRSAVVQRDETGPLPWCTLRSEPYGETALHLFFRRKAGSSLKGEAEEEELLLFLLETCLPDEKTAFRRSRANHCFLSYAAFKKRWKPVETVLSVVFDRKNWPVPAPTVLTCMLHSFPDRRAPMSLLSALVLQLDLTCSNRWPNVSDMVDSDAVNGDVSTVSSETGMSREVRRVFLATLASQELDLESMQERLGILTSIKAFVYPPNLMIMKACGSHVALHVAGNILLRDGGPVSSSLQEVESFFQALFGLLHVCRRRQEFLSENVENRKADEDVKTTSVSPPFPPTRPLAFGGRGRKLDLNVHQTHVFQRTKILFFLDLLLLCHHRLTSASRTCGDVHIPLASDPVDVSNRNFCYAPLSMCNGRLTVLDHCFELDDRTLVREVLRRGGRFSKSKFSAICSMHQFVRDTVRDQVFDVLKKMVMHTLCDEIRSDCVSVVLDYLQDTELIAFESLCTHDNSVRSFSKIPVSRWLRDPLSFWSNG